MCIGSITIFWCCEWILELCGNTNHKCVPFCVGGTSVLCWSKSHVWLFKYSFGKKNRPPILYENSVLVGLNLMFLGWILDCVGLPTTTKGTVIITIDYLFYISCWFVYNYWHVSIIYYQSLSTICSSAIFQSFTNHVPTIYQPFTSHLPAIYQPFTSHLSPICWWKKPGVTHRQVPVLGEDGFRIMAMSSRKWSYVIETNGYVMGNAVSWGCATTYTTYMYVQQYIYIYIYIYIYMNIYKITCHIDMNIIHVDSYGYTYLYMCIYTYVYIYIHMYIYIYTHMYLHI